VQHALQGNELEKLFAPRWTWRSVLLAAVFSAGVYLLLPYLETLSAPPEKTTTVRSVTTAKLQPPAPPPPRVKKQLADARPQTPKPEMQQLRRRLAPMHAAMDLGMAIGDVGGDFGVDFGISADTLGEQVSQLVFEISDLDEPPRPLARLNPIYPPQARMRRIEGEVVVEFIVTMEGAARDIAVVSSRPGDIFTSAAVRAIEGWRFTPGTKGGEAVATRVRQKVAFKLD
jgi:periplasmic protein TonB